MSIATFNLLILYIEILQKELFWITRGLNWFSNQWSNTSITNFYKNAVLMLFVRFWQEISIVSVTYFFYFCSFLSQFHGLENFHVYKIFSFFIFSNLEKIMLQGKISFFYPTVLCKGKKSRQFVHQKTQWILLKKNRKMMTKRRLVLIKMNIQKNIIRKRLKNRRKRWS